MGASARVSVHEFDTIFDIVLRAPKLPPLALVVQEMCDISTVLRALFRGGF
jgi:hypothetical protein